MYIKKILFNKRFLLLQLVLIIVRKMILSCFVLVFSNKKKVLENITRIGKGEIFKLSKYFKLLNYT